MTNNKPSSMAPDTSTEHTNHIVLDSGEQNHTSTTNEQHIPYHWLNNEVNETHHVDSNVGRTIRKYLRRIIYVCVLAVLVLLYMLYADRGYSEWLSNDSHLIRLDYRILLMGLIITNIAPLMAMYLHLSPVGYSRPTAISVTFGMIIAGSFIVLASITGVLSNDYNPTELAVIIQLVFSVIGVIALIISDDFMKPTPRKIKSWL